MARSIQPPGWQRKLGAFLNDDDGAFIHRSPRELHRLTARERWGALMLAGWVPDLYGVPLSVEGRQVRRLFPPWGVLALGDVLREVRPLNGVDREVFVRLALTDRAARLWLVTPLATAARDAA